MKVIKNITLTISLAIIIIIFIISFLNQKDKTNLRILLWQTPRTSIGNYVAISSTSGFILTYFLLGFVNTERYRTVSKRIINNKSNHPENNVNQLDEIYEQEYESEQSVLFERDLREPLPTMDVPFRIVGNASLRKKENKSTLNEQDSFKSKMEEQEPSQEDKTDSTDWANIQTDTW